MKFSVNAWFRNRIDPFARVEPLKPPSAMVAYFWHYLRQAKLPFIALLVVSGISAIIDAALFYYIGRVVDLLVDADATQGWQGLIAAHGPELAMMVVVVVIGRTLFGWLHTAIEDLTVNLGFYNLVRWQSYKHVSRQSVTFFHNDFAGSISQKVWESGNAVGDFTVSLVQTGWYISVYTITTLAVVVTLDWRLAGLMLVWMAAFAVLAVFYLPRFQRYSEEAAESSAALHGDVVDAFSNIGILKLFGTNAQNDGHIRKGFERFLTTNLRISGSITNASTILILISGIFIVLFGALCIDLWANGAMTTGGMAFTLGLVLRLNQMLMGLLYQLNHMMRYFGEAKNGAEVISKPHTLADVADAAPLKVSAGQVRFENVSFDYPPAGVQVIEGLNLDIAPGERIGLIGRSGAGKSTLINLLLRFYDPDVGRIVIDGQDIAQVTQDSLRGNIGVVTQDTALLHRSIRDNLAYGRPDASQEDVERAARIAHADEFISRLRDFHKREGYDAHVGERGVKLSGGQRQRVAIARVLLKNAPILLLDEATSALDSEVEAAIQEQLENLMQGKTVIAIAHRLSTIASMDRLVVMEQGRIVEQGTHKSLLASGGHYARLWNRQSGGFLASDAAEPPEQQS